MSDEEVEYTDSEVQDQEIAEALTHTVEPKIVYRPSPVNTGDAGWDSWAGTAQDSIDKLLKDTGTLRLGVMGVGVLSLAAIGVGAMTASIVTKMHKALTQLGANQEQLAKYMVESGVIPIHTVTGEVIPQQPNAAKAVGIDLDAPVGEPQDSGQAGEASEQVRRMLEADGPMGDIGADPTTAPIRAKHLNTETKITAKPAEPSK